MKRLVMVSLLGLSGPALLGGCAQQQVRPEPEVGASEIDPALKELNEVARDAARARWALVYAKNAEVQSKATRLGLERATIAATAVPEGWERRITVSYEGPASVLVRRLAREAGYRFYTGNLPTHEPVVLVSAREATLMDLLRSVQSQVPDAVWINVYPATRSVTMTVRPKAAM